MTVFQQNFLKENTISLIPNGGYRLAQKSSFVGRMWLEWLAKKRKIKIQSAENNSEKKIKNFFVDGFYLHPDKKEEIFEFNGCFYHGCVRCFPDRNAKIGDSNETMGFRYEATEHKEAILRSTGAKLTIMWECTFAQMRKEDSEINDFINNHKDVHTEPLEARDSFFGGRTNCVKTHYIVAPGEKIKYMDVCSLYPWVNKYGTYAVDVPEIFIGEQCCELIGSENDLVKVEGLVKCTVLAPTDLYHPVLPQRINGKLFFSLCRTCANNEIQTECPHVTDTLREFTGTWVSCELKLAIRKGYKIIKVHEIWQYQSEKYDPESQTGGIFTSYINKFLKMKVEASGWPSWCICRRFQNQRRCQP
jgi:hypothetical protein